MTASFPFPARYLGALGIVLLVAAFLLVLRPVLSSSDSTSSSAPATQPSVGSPATPSKPAPAPAVKLTPGLPTAVAARLRKENVVVVSVYSGTSSDDRALVGVSRKGAKTSGAAFLALNILSENSARDVSKLIGAVDVPATAVVRRPGKVVTVIEGTVDSELVAQAAHNAGARR